MPAIDFTGHDKIHLEWVGNGSRKFYDGDLLCHTVSWGRIGLQQGLTNMRTRAAVEKKLREKIRKGYVWVRPEMQTTIEDGKLVRFRKGGIEAMGPWVGASGVTSNKAQLEVKPGAIGLVAELYKRDVAGRQWDLYKVIIGERGIHLVARAYLEEIDED